MNQKDKLDWLNSYYSLYKESIFDKSILKKMVDLSEIWEKDCRQKGKKIIFAGNGGSAAMASHCAVDFTKNANIRAINFNEPDLITCLSNDYGYENWVSSAIEMYADEGDHVVLFSSSGNSKNMLNAAKFVKANDLFLTTFTGFSKKNLLRKEGNFNFWVNSNAYNIVEMTHHIWILSLCDLLIGDAYYSAN
tara:strand:- start:4433 stop:5008 length:576 start_codon:yes stop_codon:yes gene_type:complete